MTQRPTTEQALAHPRRARLLDLVRSRPGIELAQAAREMGSAKSPVDWHARVLARAGLIVDERRAGKKRLFFPAKVDE